MSAYPPGWKDLEEIPAPREVRLLIWGNGRIRFGVLDKLGNWRADHNGPIKVSPRYWRFPPAPPEKYGIGGTDGAGAVA